jgi:hypothetical protein
VKTFNLNSLDAQVVFRTAMSQWAELHPLRGEAKVMIPAAEPERPRLELRSRAQFGLKVIV